MSTDALNPDAERSVSVILVGQGEPLLRMEKRLRCAAKALAIKLDVIIRKDVESFDVAYADTPLLLDGSEEILSRGLLSTEQLEVLLGGIHD